ncbi:cysteine peptidase family C39 domain-containing protein, partial [Pseudomonas viridiflava]|uniref:cysteine peptidase family C39 domain-containing protein n=1 Tax=Pseudomonas viridiflava TaxID=33069 RepID=UPI001F11ECA7
DPLLGGLMMLCRLHGRSNSRASLSAGLPMSNQRLEPSLMPRAAARAGLQARWLRRDLEQIHALNLPVLLLLKDQHCAVLVRRDESGRLLIQPSEN